MLLCLCHIQGDGGCYCACVTFRVMAGVIVLVSHSGVMAGVIVLVSHSG